MASTTQRTSAGNTSSRTKAKATRKPTSAKAPSARITRLVAGEGVVVDAGADVAWLVVPEKLDGTLYRQWKKATGGDELPFDADLVREFRVSAAEVCDGRWTLVEAIGGPTAVLVWIALMHPGLTPEQREEAWLDLQTWSGIRIEGEGSGPGWVALEGDPYGTMDYGMVAHQLRYYAEHGVVFHVASEDEDAVRRVLEGLHVGARAAKREPPPAPKERTFASLLAPEERAKGLAACPGPATRDLQRLASSLVEPSMEFEATLSDGGTFSLVILGGEKEPFWMPSFDTNPPGGGYLSDCLAGMKEKLRGRTVVDTSAELKRPRGDGAITAFAAARFAEAVGEIANATLAAPRRARKR